MTIVVRDVVVNLVEIDLVRLQQVSLEDSEVGMIFIRVHPVGRTWIECTQILGPKVLEVHIRSKLWFVDLTHIKEAKTTMCHAL
jgi:hypothetical protein